MQRLLAWLTSPSYATSHDNVQFITNSLTFRPMTFAPSPERYDVAACHVTSEGKLEHATVARSYDNVWVIRNESYALLYVSSTVSFRVFVHIVDTERALNGLTDTTRRRIRDMIPMKLEQMRKVETFSAILRWWLAYRRVYDASDVALWRLVLNRFETIAVK